MSRKGVGWLPALGLVLAGGLSAAAAEEAAPSEAALRFAREAVPVEGSEAGEGLQAQVAARLFDMEQAARPTCTPRLLNAKVIEPEEGGAWAERWFVRGCNQILPYRVAFAPDQESVHPTFTVLVDVGTHGAPSR